jgi:hypothetical protein
MISVPCPAMDAPFKEMALFDGCAFDRSGGLFRKRRQQRLALTIPGHGSPVRLVSKKMEVEQGFPTG